jgi:type I restriction enzyme M protein
MNGLTATDETAAASSIISKVWSFCNTLRDDGVSYGDYLEQLTYLLFLKMADEFSKPPYNRKLAIPEEYGWESLTSRKGAELEGHYTTLLRELSQTKGTLARYSSRARTRFRTPPSFSSSST